MPEFCSLLVPEKSSHLLIKICLDRAGCGNGARISIAMLSQQKNLSVKWIVHSAATLSFYSRASAGIPLAPLLSVTQRAVQVPNGPLNKGEGRNRFISRSLSHRDLVLRAHVRKDDRALITRRVNSLISKLGLRDHSEHFRGLPVRRAGAVGHID